MAQWRLRPLGDFPPLFHQAMRAGEGVDKLAGAYYTHSAAKSAQEQFRLFRFCIRNSPSSPLYRIEFDLYHRTKVAWGDRENRWLLLLSSRRSALEDMTNFDEVFGKNG